MLDSTPRHFVFTRIVFQWQWRFTLLFVLVAAAIVAAHELIGFRWLELPALPLSVVGAALGIFVSFRTNSAYARWWEGRKLWGRMINTSRHWTSQCVAYVREPDARRRLVLRHAAYVHTLRCLLRGQDPFADEEVLRHLDPDHEVLRRETNLTHALLSRQLDEVTALSDDGRVDAFRLQSLDESLRHLLDIQGGCERIKKTPMPPIYGLLATRLVTFYSFLLPLALVHSMGWWSIPINLLVCTAFSLIAEAGRVLEDPFTLYYNGLPLSAISRMIEVNIRQRIGDDDLPPMLKPDATGLLM